MLVFIYLFSYQNVAYEIIHTDNLHPSRLQFIKLLRRKRYSTGRFDLLGLEFANSRKKR